MVLRSFAEFAVGERDRGLSAEVQQAANRAVVDGFAATVAGSVMDAAAIMRATLLDGTELAVSQYADAGPMLVDATVMPIIALQAPITAEAALATPELVAEVLVDALSGGAEAGMSIDDLLAALPSAGDGALLGGLSQEFGGASMVLAAHSMAFHFEATLAVHLDSVTVA